MARTVADIEKRLARMLGSGGTDPVNELADGEAEDLRDLVQETLTKCFIPVNGSRPKWSEQKLALTFRSPVTLTIGVTQGSTAVTGVPTSIITGERVVIGNTLYTYAGNGALLSEWADATGTVGATFYQVCKPIPGNVSGIEAPVNCLEHGPLSPLMDEEQELMLRSYYQNDFYPLSRAYHSITNSRRYRSDPKGYDIGDPWFYYIDSAAVDGSVYPTPVTPSGAIQMEGSIDDNIEIDGLTYDGALPAHYISQRMYLYPFPDAAVTVEYRGTINPRIVDGTTALHLPADVMDACFMPMARYAVATHFPNYPGDNVALLRRNSEDGAALLQTLGRPQRRRSGPLSPAQGW